MKRLAPWIRQDVIAYSVIALFGLLLLFLAVWGTSQKYDQPHVYFSRVNGQAVACATEESDWGRVPITSAACNGVLQETHYVYWL